MRKLLAGFVGASVAGILASGYVTHEKEVWSFERPPAGSEGVMDRIDIIEIDKKRAAAYARVGKHRAAEVAREVGGAVKSALGGEEGKPETANKTLAPPVLVELAAKEIRLGKSPLCPTDAKHYVPLDPALPNTQVCINASDIRIDKTPDGKIKVIASLAINPEYPAAADVDLVGEFKDFTKERCRGVNVPLQDFFVVALENTSSIPEGQTADVGLVVRHDAQTPCDTYVPRSSLLTPTTAPFNNQRAL